MVLIEMVIDFYQLFIVVPDISHQSDGHNIPQVIKFSVKAFFSSYNGFTCLILCQGTKTGAAFLLTSSGTGAVMTASIRSTNLIHSEPT